jgi:predicted ribosomally synthesized peptide with SipW-like signal peptide
MRNIVLSLVMVGVLVAASVGGTFATWSDSETSLDNIIKTGSLDLKVNGADDEPWGSGVPPKVNIDCMVPCKLYGPYEVELWNAGQCECPSSAYIHLKDACCGNVDPKVHPETGESTGYPCPETGDLKPEPELVAEFGGKVDCREVPGIGRTGDDCSMLSHIYLWVTDEAGNVLVEGKLITHLCEEIYLFDLMPCEPRTIYLWFHLQQESEEDYDLDIFPADDPDEWKFNDWPSAAMMKDKVVFSMEFDLVLFPNPPCPPPPGYPVA